MYIIIMYKDIKYRLIKYFQYLHCDYEFYAMFHLDYDNL